jgi:ABC-type transporter MlaC component
MDGIVLPDGRVSIPFEQSNGKYVLRDAIVLGAEDAAAMSQEEFDVITQQRFDAWIAHLEAEPFPITDVPPDSPGE